MTPEMAKRREFVVRVALSVGASLLPWRLASGAPASGSDLVSPPSTKLLASLPDRMGRGRVNSDVMVRARDGIGLATDVYLPDGPGPFPSVLTRLPYGKTEAYCAMPVVADLWNRRGYAAVVQDVRGKWGSEGVFEPNLARNEISDGHDTVDWIAKQPWSNGRVGMWGESYFGFTTWAAAVSQHPALVAIAPGDITVNRYNATFRGGALQLNTVGIWAIELMARQYQDVSKVDTWHLPLADIANAAGVPSSYFDAIIANPHMSPFWEARSLLGAYDQVRIPVLHWGGWYDCYLGPMMADWRMFRAKNAGKNSNHLFIGPWDHEGSPDTTHRAGLMPLPTDTGEQRWATFAAFFDRYLSGVDRSFGAGGPVRYFVLGANEWRNATAWPPTNAKPVRLFLRGGGRLSNAPPGKEASENYDYDPANPVAWTAAVNCWSIAEGMGDRQPIEERADVLTYSTGPLAHAVEITGPVKAHLWVTSSAPATDFVVALCDVFPDGRVNVIQDGILRTTEVPRFRAHIPTKLEIDLWSTAYRVEAGHRVRVEVTSSDFNRYDRNPNTAAPFGREASPVVAHQSILHDETYQSAIHLSVTAGFQWFDPRGQSRNA
jgi:putative CocE/NonD family hydrolase